MSRVITVAKNAGFCSGVRLAIKKAYESAEKYGKIFMLGDIVHNEYVVKDLRESGISVVDGIEQIEKNAPVLFRAHGTPKEIWKRAQKKGLIVIDATCPLVMEIHRYAKELESEGRKILIVGDRIHDEVEAIVSQVKDPIVLSKTDDAIRMENISRAGVVIQSTQSIDNVNSIISLILPKIKDLRIINTICAPTRKRQAEIKELANQNDVMIIVGSKTSANTKRLTEISKTINKRSYQVQDAIELEESWFIDANKVGITGGASTPDFIIESVVKKITTIP